MNLRHIRIFVEIYRTCNITHASEALHMTQPSVTRALQEMEQTYHIRLFERMYHRLTPHRDRPPALPPGAVPAGKR